MRKNVEKKIIAVVGSCEAAPDKVVMNVIKEVNFDHVYNNNKDKWFLYDASTNRIYLCDTGNVSLLTTLPEQPSYVNNNDNYVVGGYGFTDKGNPKRKASFKKLIRYTLSQLLPGRVRDGKLDSLSDLGLNLGRELTASELSALNGQNEKLKAKVVDGLLKEGFDRHYEKEKQLIISFPLTEERILDLDSVSRGNVQIPKEKYVTNVMKDGDGRSENLPLASKMLARQRAKEQYEKQHGKGSFEELSKKHPDKAKELIEEQNVQKWMEKNGYTWHEIDDEANLQKVPTHLHACVRHAGAVITVQDKYEGNCYGSELQQSVADNALDRAIEINKQNPTKESSNRVALLEKHASEKKLAEIKAKEASNAVNNEEFNID